MICLCGNHEEALIRVLRGESEQLSGWLMFGGAECLKSYGLSPASLTTMNSMEAVRSIREAIPRVHAEYLLSLPNSLQIGDYLFVHAGIRPGVKLKEQTEADYRWIRDPFLSHRGDHGFIVVHGHTISQEAVVLSNRVGIDTGAYRSGVLTAIALEGSNRWFLQSRLSRETAQDTSK